MSKEQSIIGNNNIQVSGNLTINVAENKPRPTRTNFTPDYNIHISEANAKAISDKIHTMAKQIADPSYYRVLFGKLNNHFKINTYRALPKGLFNDAMHYLDVIDHTQIQPKLRKTNVEEWRKSKYAAIHAKANSLGWSHEDLYSTINQYLAHKNQYTSLKELSDTALKKVYEYIIRK